MIGRRSILVFFSLSAHRHDGQLSTLHASIRPHLIPLAGIRVGWSSHGLELTWLAWLTDVYNGGITALYTNTPRGGYTFSGRWASSLRYHDVLLCIWCIFFRAHFTPPPAGWTRNSGGKDQWWCVLVWTMSVGHGSEEELRALRRRTGEEEKSLTKASFKRG